MKKTAVLLALTLTLSGTFCGMGSAALAEAAVETAEESDFYAALSQLEGVTSVAEIEQSDAVYAEKYMVTFTQPVDWENPDAGTFEQRVELGYQGDDAINCYQVNGYCLNDKMMDASILGTNDSSEPAILTRGNFINIEYRFFGDSVPEGLSNDSVDLWQYLTTENAAKDFKYVIDQLSTILPGKKIFSGGSKGGYTTNTMAYYYPDLCDAYIAYVAPLCDGTQDPVCVKNVYETIGDLGYTAEEAAAMRQEMLDFEVLCIENREDMQEAIWEVAMNEGDTYRDFVTKEILYDMTVMNCGLQYWQYGADFAGIEAVLAMPDTTEEEHAAIEAQMLQLLVSIGQPNSWSTNTPMFPYYIQTQTEMGENLYDFSYLRAAVIEKTGTDMLAITEEMQDNIVAKMVLTDEQRAAFQYDDTMRNALIEWSNTTEAHVIMIYGGCDVWYPTRIPDTDNPNVHIYVQNNGCHTSLMSTLAQDDMIDCMGYLRGWVN